MLKSCCSSLSVNLQTTGKWLLTTTSSWAHVVDLNVCWRALLHCRTHECSCVGSSERFYLLLLQVHYYMGLLEKRKGRTTKRTKSIIAIIVICLKKASLQPGFCSKGSSQDFWALGFKLCQGTKEMEILRKKDRANCLGTLGRGNGYNVGRKMPNWNESQR